MSNAPAAPPTASLPRGPHAVLLVDDQELVAAMLRRALNGHADLHLHHCGKSEQALAMAQQVQPAVILQDLHMPGTDGLTLLQRYRGEPQLAHVPVVILSSTDDAQMKCTCFAAGANDYVVKLPDVVELLARVRYHAQACLDHVERLQAEQRIMQLNAELERRVLLRTTELAEATRTLQAAYTELKVTQEQVVQQERLHALGQMASGIAHDFNNALVPIMGYTEMMLGWPEFLDNREEVLANLKLIHTAAKDAAHVVSRLREFYRVRAVAEVFAPVSLDAIAREAIDLTLPKWRNQALAQGVEVQVELVTQDTPQFPGSEAELREALTNLLINAVDAVVARVEQQRLAGATVERAVITVVTGTTPGWVTVEVSDTGTGMSEEVRQRCLEPFFSTKGERGTGMGLAMVFGIVRRHQGTIEIKSQVGQGTSFTLRFALTPTAKMQVAKLADTAIGRSLRVLLADDDPGIRRLLESYLARAEHQVTTCANGREALERFRPEQFDIVITDRAMPEMGGDQLAGEIKRRAPQTPVIMLSGFGDMMMAAGELPPGVDLILTKPFSVTAITVALKRASMLCTPAGS